MIYAILVTLFAIAAMLTIAAHFKQWNWASTAAVSVPGLGVAAVWPVRVLIRLNREELALRLFPDLLPLLSSSQAAQLAEGILSVLSGGGR
jgi:hypothetical protein